MSVYELEPIKADGPTLESNYGIEWSLPGNGESGPECFKTFYYSHEDHYTSKIHYCGRFECPKCWGHSWLARETSHISDRLEYGKEYWKLYGKKLIHVVISPPGPVGPLMDHQTFARTRNKAEKLLKKAGMLGGVIIYHHFRMPNDNHPLADSPHFHVVGYGWIQKTEKIFEETGWIIKNLGVRISTRETIRYQLSHASMGILPMQQGTILTTVWFGILSYNKMEIEKKDGQRIMLCLYCKKEIPESDFHRINVYGPKSLYGLLSEISYDDHIPEYLDMRT